MTRIDGNGRAYVQGLVQGKLEDGTRLGSSDVRRPSYEATSRLIVVELVRGQMMVARRVFDPPLNQAVPVLAASGNANAGSALMAPATSSNFGSV